MTTTDWAYSPATEALDEVSREAALEAPGFGLHYTDHMVTIRWSAADGWHDPQVEPFGPLQLHPATAVLHYAQEIFEGLKAHRGRDGTITLFRLGDHAARLNSSARRMAMPELPPELFEQACRELVSHDQGWVGLTPGSCVYLRPFMVAMTEGLGAGRPGDSFLFSVIASPATPTGGRLRTPISVWASQTMARSVRGGTGAAKTGANYAMGLLGQAEARKEGCDQVLWLDAIEHTWVEELGAMNVFLVRGTGEDATIVTPPLSDTLLPGITRDSVLTIARRLGLGVEETPISIGEWQRGVLVGEITEAFATGSAGGLTPIGLVRTADAEWQISPDGQRPVGGRLAAALDVAQTDPDDAYGWLSPVPVGDADGPTIERTP